VQNVGHVFAAVRTDLFIPDGEFRRRMDAILRMLKASPPAPGGPGRVLVPGEIELASESRNKAHGVVLAASTAAQLAALATELGVAFPSGLASPSTPESVRA
jgi:LDH2 family malate/lactate/ureidoglycolate dehydrogenase